MPLLEGECLGRRRERDHLPGFACSLFQEEREFSHDLPARPFWHGDFIAGYAGERLGPLIAARHFRVVRNAPETAPKSISEAARCMLAELLQPAMAIRRERCHCTDQPDAHAGPRRRYAVRRSAVSASRTGSASPSMVSPP